MKKYGKLIISDRGLEARSDGATIMSQISKKWFEEQVLELDWETQIELFKCVVVKELKLKQIKILAKLSWSGEWHHSGQYASKVEYYWVHDIADYIIKNKDSWEEKVNQEIKKRVDSFEQNNQTKVIGEYAVFTGSRKHPKLSHWTKFEGTLIGNWIHIGNSKKKANGNWIKFDEVKNEAIVNNEDLNDEKI